MPNSDLNARLGNLYRALQDRPLTPDDPRYLPFLQESGVEDPIAELATRIEWTESASVHLLTGQRGSGKSTELRRLHATLEAHGCRVFLCDMREYMNLTTPVEISDFCFPSSVRWERPPMNAMATTQATAATSSASPIG